MVDPKDPTLECGVQWVVVGPEDVPSDKVTGEPEAAGPGTTPGEPQEQAAATWVSCYSQQAVSSKSSHCSGYKGYKERGREANQLKLDQAQGKPLLQASG